MDTESSLILEWAMNSIDQLQDPLHQIETSTYNGGLQESLSGSPDYCYTSCPTIHHTLRNTSFHNQTDLHERQAKDHMTNSWDNGDSLSPNSILPTAKNPKSVSWNFGGNLQSKQDTVIGKREGFKMVDKRSMIPHTRDHIIAERKRREKLNQRFIELSTIIPCLKKTDKASILIDAVKYVKELQEKVKTLESHNTKSTVVESVISVKNNYGSSSSNENNKAGSSTSSEALPEIEARVSENGILLNIHFENAKGLLVKLLYEIEELNLTVTHTNMMPFPGCTSFITIAAKIEEGFNLTAEDVVRKLSLALHRFISGNEGD